METFHLFHLGSVWRPHPLGRDSTMDVGEANLPSIDLPASPHLSSSPKEDNLLVPGQIAPWKSGGSARIRAAAAQIVFANRTSREFITPKEVEIVEGWTGEAILECLCSFEIPSTVRILLEDKRTLTFQQLIHPEAGSVWEPETTG